jgi:hypothetical protein
VLENDTTKNTKGKIYPDSGYKLMARSQYAKMGNPLGADARFEERAAGNVRSSISVRLLKKFPVSRSAKYT